MKKLWQFVDNNSLKIFVGFLIGFIVLYPKLPSVHVPHTWVYVRLEDFFIGATSIVWLLQVIRKKARLPFPLAWSLVIYWAVGLISLVFCLLVVAPHLANFFPNVAILQYLRRIEYMILFFVGFSVVKTKKDIRNFLIVLFITIVGIVLYGLRQRFYVTLWHLFPIFFASNPFCFPAFLTGNEEFAKGIPFCLADTSRVASTFGGHYDLAAYLVLVIPVLIAVCVAMKKLYIRIISFILVVASLALLNCTSSRTSFPAYLIGAIAGLIFWKKKWWIIPVMIVSIGILLTYRGETLARFLKTIQPVNVVTVNQSLPTNLQKIITKAKEAEENQTPEKPPPGTITLSAPVPAAVAPKTPVAATSPVTTVLTDQELQKLTAENVEIAISTKSGAFLIQKAYALDISFTTRFQAEWPRDFAAFVKYPLLGSGYSSLTLASDNDYLRALGETGALGFIAFALIFVMLGIFMKEKIKGSDSLTQTLVFGLAGGTVGLLMNALLIDVFEASKVGESFWLLVGIAAGALYVNNTGEIHYVKKLKTFFSSSFLLATYLFIGIFVFFGKSLSNFFIADDFTWLKWGATGSFHDIGKYFYNAQGFFYRPLSKTLMIFFFSIFSFQPVGYHIVDLFIHFGVSLGVYVLSLKLLKKKLFAFITACFFLLLPMHFENMYWISTLSDNLGALWMVWRMVVFMKFREEKKWLRYCFVVLFGVLSLLSYEQAIIYPLLLLVVDICITRHRFSKQDLLAYAPFVLLDIVYVAMRPFVHVAAVGGDYAYNFAHIVPNIVGNMLGYIGLSLFGPMSLPWYGALRQHAKFFSLPLSIILLLLILLLIKEKKKLLQLKNYISIEIWFGILVFCIGVIPFLPLGNITPRYGYVSSIGFVVLLTIFMGKISSRFSHFFAESKNVAIICLSILIGAFFVSQLNIENNEWHSAVAITK